MLKGVDVWHYATVKQQPEKLENSFTQKHGIHIIQNPCWCTLHPTIPSAIELPSQQTEKKQPSKCYLPRLKRKRGAFCLIFICFKFSSFLDCHRKSFAVIRKITNTFELASAFLQGGTKIFVTSDNNLSLNRIEARFPLNLSAKQALKYCQSVLNILFVTKFVTSSVTVLYVVKISVYDEIVLETWKSYGWWKSKEIFYEFPSKRWFASKIHSLLRPTDAKVSSDSLPYCSYVGQDCRRLGHA